MSDPKLAEAVRIVREQTIPALAGSGGGGHADALETVLAALEAAGAWQADRAAVCEDRERLIAEMDRLKAGMERCDLAQHRHHEQLLRERDEARAEVERLRASALPDVVPEDVDALKAALAAERERSERLLAALGFAYTELCEIERLNTSSKEQARHIFRAIGFCKWDKQPEWDERMTAALAPARAEVERLKGRVLMSDFDAQVRRAEKAEAALAEAQAQLRQSEVLGDQAEQELEHAEATLAAERERSERLRDLILAWADTQASSDIRPFSDLLVEARCIREDRAALAPAQPERRWQNDADPHPGRAQAAYQAQREREERP